MRHGATARCYFDLAFMNSHIALVASGPSGSDHDTAAPPDHACPMPWISHASRNVVPPGPAYRATS